MTGGALLLDYTAVRGGWIRGDGCGRPPRLCARAGRVSTGEQMWEGQAVRSDAAGLGVGDGAHDVRSWLNDTWIAMSRVPVVA